MDRAQRCSASAPVGNFLLWVEDLERRLRCPTQTTVSPCAWGQISAAPPHVIGVPDALIGNWEVLRAMGGTRNEQDLHGCAGSLADYGPGKLSSDTAGREEEQ